MGGVGPGRGVVAVVGATGTGKSDLAIEIARAVGGEIVNTDSMQFYRGMDIGTAKLAPEERGGIPHHLLDVLEVTEEASVAAFQAEADAAVRQLLDRGKTPVLVGGSGLYVRAAVDELEFPPTDPQVRSRLEEEARRRGIGPLAERLAAVDPVSAGRLKDERRIIRALEVHEITGRTFESFMPQRRYLRPTVQLGLAMDRAELHARLELRIERMMREGLVEEARRLCGHGLREARTASRAIGYRQALEVIDGTMNEAEAAASTLTATRQFARRQETWFRADPRVIWLDATAPDLLEQALRAVADGLPHGDTLVP
ncbi:tRNA (adenosine(37)-N6)-dimethylallyltransferase MiaA [Arthrobacter sp. UM1]|uniref:tRNA (adenosine(37)-N6)-dimethylallyltransferase MiaA n=1 Tax=Arthrobacter sp. UM1 TaxID=2766776 RepID=UPI001CF6ED8A|nr:tRNA (adenosine(37)-N6)-dimethylallyltransferase MiaA [Arthrobacter sp. UM1]MCB4208103.1 tRNA (adenosine(37)-N6)-dimethylallyltransferase MiaA [Arthrobacter sp. UM1]